MLTSGSSDDFSMHPQICRFATVWGLIIKESAVARKAQQKNLLKILMDSVGATVGFEKERSCMSNELSALTLRCFHSTIGIPSEEFY